MATTPSPDAQVTETNRPRAVLLDLGGVVIDINVAPLFERWARAAGLPVEQLMSRWGADDAYKRHETGDLDFDGYCAHLAAKLGIELPPEEWREGWNAIFVGPYNGVVARLPRIAERFDLCCYSNTNDAHHAAWSTRYAGELKPFRRVYVSSTIRRRKPDVASFQWVARDMGYAPEQILFIDDTLENIEGARAAGLRAVQARGEEAVSRALDNLL
jgi:putative hydrolase of the HAD superfamily